MSLGTILGQAHLKADDWVQAFQDPFGSFLSQIYDPLKKASDAGTLTSDQVSQAQTQFDQQWTAFDSAAQQWKAKGGDYATVVGQSYDPGGAFMQTVDMVKSSLAGWTSSLPATSSTTSNAPPAPPTLQTILTGGPDAAAAAAADQQSKRAAATTNTILTSGMGLSELSSQNRKYATLLGY